MEALKEISAKINELLGIPIWKIGIAVGIVFLSVVLRRLFVFFVVKAISRFVRATETKIDDILFRALSKPASFIFVLAGIWFSAKYLGADALLLRKLLGTFAFLILGWAFYNLIKEFESYIFTFVKRFGEEFAHEIGNFTVKLLRIFVVIMIGLSILQTWGVNVSAIIASLGIGGLAVALAAKDTLANIISGFIILLDRPLKVGETVRIGDIAGNVEEIGLRTTRIRTFDKTLVTIPNQNLTNAEIDNWSRREIRRVRMYIGVVYSTTRDQMKKILEDIRDMLQNHPGVSKKEKIIVYFEEFGDSSLNILVQYYTVSADYAEYLSIREDVNLKIMDIVERNGSSFAFPSRSIYFETPMPKDER